MVSVCLTYLLNLYLIRMIQVHQAVNHFRATTRRPRQLADVYYWALQITLKIMKDPPVTYRRRLQGP